MNETEYLKQRLEIAERAAESARKFQSVWMRQAHIYRVALLQVAQAYVDDLPTSHCVAVAQRALEAGAKVTP